jgi:hypothetical protein
MFTVSYLLDRQRQQGLGRRTLCRNRFQVTGLENREIAVGQVSDVIRIKRIDLR